MMMYSRHMLFVSFAFLYCEFVLVKFLEGAIVCLNLD